MDASGAGFCSISFGGHPMKIDLHIHSCLSPCANLEMSPGEIVKRAVDAGMGGIALTDHQSARNTPAIAECARRAGLKCLYGLEVCTAEEVHTIALFDTTEQALAMTEWVYAAMPKRVNDPDVFGDQPVVTWDDDIVDMEWRILALGCRKMIPETAEKCHELGGVYIAAHIDRPNFSKNTRKFSLEINFLHSVHFKASLTFSVLRYPVISSIMIIPVFHINFVHNFYCFILIGLF